MSSGSLLRNLDILRRSIQPRSHFMTGFAYGNPIINVKFQSKIETHFYQTSSSPSPSYAFKDPVWFSQQSTFSSQILCTLPVKAFIFCFGEGALSYPLVCILLKPLHASRSGTKMLWHALASARYFFSQHRVIVKMETRKLPIFNNALTDVPNGTDWWYI